MSYRFVKITNFDTTFLQNYYGKNSQISTKSYQEQYQHLMNQNYAWANYFQIHFQKIGVEAHEIVANATHLQEAWAKEHNTTKKDTSLLLEQLKTIKPDVIHFQNPVIYTKDFILQIRETVPSVKKIIGHCSFPYSKENLETFSSFDFTLAGSPKFKYEFDNYNLKAFEFNHGFEASQLIQVAKNTTTIPESNMIFLGSFLQSQDFHDGRIKFIQDLIDNHIDIQIYTQLQTDSNLSLHAKQGAYLFVQFLKKIGLTNLALNHPILKKFIRLNEMPKKTKHNPSFVNHIIPKSLYGIDMLKALTFSKIGFNIHGGVAGDYAANVRLFEVTGVGTCLLTDHKKNIHNFFEPDKEVVTYKSSDECIEKYNWLINHPTEREEIAKAGQKRTLKDHSIESRVNLLHDIIRKELKKN